MLPILHMTLKLASTHPSSLCALLSLQSLSEDGSDLSSLDSEEEALDYEAQLEEQLEDAYQQYLHRKGKQVLHFARRFVWRC
jgi:hypothetical protein